MVERRERLRFASQPRHSLGISRKRLRQNFQRHVSVQTRIPRAVHFSHPARAYRAGDFIRPNFACYIQHFFCLPSSLATRHSPALSEVEGSLATGFVTVSSPAPSNSSPAKLSGLLAPYRSAR